MNFEWDISNKYYQNPSHSGIQRSIPNLSGNVSHGRGELLLTGEIRNMQRISSEWERNNE